MTRLTQRSLSTVDFTDPTSRVSSAWGIYSASAPESNAVTEKEVDFIFDDADQLSEIFRYEEEEYVARSAFIYDDASRLQRIKHLGNIRNTPGDEWICAL